MDTSKKSAVPSAENDSVMTETLANIKISIDKVIRGKEEIAIKLSAENMDNDEIITVHSNPVITKDNRQYKPISTDEFEELEKFDGYEIRPDIIVEGHIIFKNPGPGPFKIILTGVNYHYASGAPLSKPTFTFTLNN